MLAVYAALCPAPVLPRPHGWESCRLTPREQIKGLRAQPAFLVQSRGDSQAPFASCARLVRHALPHGETWVREGDQYMILPPESLLSPAADAEHADRILRFLDRRFGRPRTG